MHGERTEAETENAFFGLPNMVFGKTLFRQPISSTLALALVMNVPAVLCVQTQPLNVSLCRVVAGAVVVVAPAAGRRARWQYQPSACQAGSPSSLAPP